MGETGTGKELIARTIHNLSARADRRMISVNCAALPAELIESELFGHEEGAFTGASSVHYGRFELANESTLFLDEIGDLPLPLQSKLLRVIQEGEFERLGGSETIRVNVRLIAATNRDLEKAIDEGKFRSDLYYRISTFPIVIPPLRERKEDIPILVKHFVNKLAPKFNKEIKSISSPMLDHLLDHEWPGNVRELENYIARAILTCEGSTLTVDPRESMLGEESGIGISKLHEQGMKLEQVERSHILSVLNRTGWKIAGRNGAAEMLGLPPSTLRSRMKKLKIQQA